MGDRLCLLEGREAASSDEPERFGATAVDGRTSDLSFHTDHHPLWPNARSFLSPQLLVGATAGLNSLQMKAEFLRVLWEDLGTASSLSPLINDSVCGLIDVAISCSSNPTCDALLVQKI